MNKNIQDMKMLEVDGDNIVLFHPFVPEQAIQEVEKTLRSRWIGQGPRVDVFEERFCRKFAEGLDSHAVGSGTDALHLAYVLSNLQPGDEVISTVFTCTATNIPLLYHGVTIRFADIQKETMNIDPNHVAELVNERTRAIVGVDYGGLPCDLEALENIAKKWNIPLVEDAAQAVGATYQGRPIGSIADFTAFSFQAIKHITTGDGGMLVVKDPSLREKVKRIRWFGIDREAKQKGIWENDIYEIGYKYQMTDIGAAIGLASLDMFDEILAHRQGLFQIYCDRLRDTPGIYVVGTDSTDRTHAAWICTVVAEGRLDLQKKLREHRIESNQVHFRNDRYSIFSNFRGDFPNMDAIEDNYLVLPIHMQMENADAERICDLIASGW